MIKNKIRDIVLYVWKEFSDTEIEFQVENPPKNIKADFAANICLLGSKQLGISPRELATRFVQLVKDKNIGNDVIDQVLIAGPGFVNFVLKNSVYYEELIEIFKQQDKYGHAKDGKGKNVLIEFVSANPTGPLHIGHARGAAFGDSLARILKAAGYNVSREYYINDAGNQISILAHSTEVRLRQLRGEDIALPVDCYKGEYIIEIAKEINEKFPDHDIEKIDIKAYAVKAILKLIEDDLKNFGVVYDSWFSESSLFQKQKESSPFEKTIEMLKEKNFLKKEDGAWWLRTKDLNHDEKNRVVIREDNRPTYLATDMAYHHNKYNRGFDILVDIWGADHHGYVSRLKASVSYLGYDPESLKIILYQLVSLLRHGKRIAMSTREGKFVPLKEVVDEVGADACRFFLLMRTGDSHFEFDLDLAKEQSSENPVYYVQYAHARISSLLRESKDAYNDAMKEAMNRLPELLTEEEELELIKIMAHFPYIIQACINSYSPHHIPTYLLELAAGFHKYYTKHRILVSDNASLAGARLLLCKGVAQIIKNGLHLLGISAPERM